MPERSGLRKDTLTSPLNCIDPSSQLESNDLELHNVFHRATVNSSECMQAACYISKCHLFLQTNGLCCSQVWLRLPWNVESGPITMASRGFADLWTQVLLTVNPAHKHLKTFEQQLCSQVCPCFLRNQPTIRVWRAPMSKPLKTVFVYIVKTKESFMEIGRRLQIAFGC